VLEQVIKFNQPVNISTKDGHAVVISEADYRPYRDALCFVGSRAEGTDSGRDERAIV